MIYEVHKTLRRYCVRGQSGTCSVEFICVTRAYKKKAHVAGEAFAGDGRPHPCPPSARFYFCSTVWRNKFQSASNPAAPHPWAAGLHTKTWEKLNCVHHREATHIFSTLADYSFTLGWLAQPSCVYTTPYSSTLKPNQQFWQWKHDIRHNPQMMKANCQ